jgi:hypothetical protein
MLLNQMNSTAQVLQPFPDKQPSSNGLKAHHRFSSNPNPALKFVFPDISPPALYYNHHRTTFLHPVAQQFPSDCRLNIRHVVDQFCDLIVEILSIRSLDGDGGIDHTITRVDDVSAFMDKHQKVDALVDTASEYECTIGALDHHCCLLDC